MSHDESKKPNLSTRRATTDWGMHEPAAAADADADALSPRDMSLLRVAVAAAGHRTTELRTHLATALTHDITPEEPADVLEEAARLAGHRSGEYITLLRVVLHGAEGLPR